MKKIYIPTIEELHQLQDLGMNVHKYLVAKVIEALIMEDQIYLGRNMLNFAYQNLSEYPEIAHTICRMYPERKKHSKNTTSITKDIGLAQKLTEKIPSQDKSIYYLDDALESFTEEVLLDKTVIRNVSRILADKLLSTPRYRFDYKEPNILLDYIFGCDLSTSLITEDAIADFIIIDPVYYIKLGLNKFDQSGKINQQTLFNFNRGMTIYSIRYGLPEYIQYKGRDILTKPDEKTRKLIRTLEYHQENYY